MKEKGGTKLAWQLFRCSAKKKRKKKDHSRKNRRILTLVLSSPLSCFVIMVNIILCQFHVQGEQRSEWRIKLFFFFKCIFTDKHVDSGCPCPLPHTAHTDPNGLSPRQIKSDSDDDDLPNVTLDSVNETGSTALSIARAVQEWVSRCEVWAHVWRWRMSVLSDYWPQQL